MRIPLFIILRGIFAFQFRKNYIIMGKHSEWRKLAKKARRKRIRQIKAKLRDRLEEKEQQKQENSPRYKKFLEEQTKAEECQAREEARLAAERDLQWRKVEEEAQKQWQELQKKLAAAKEERIRQNEKIRLEWEEEQKKRNELKEQKERELEEKLREQEILNEKTNDFIVNGGSTPEHLKIKLETNPNKPPCSFFQKTSACRFYDVCSRNHIRPGISRILLFPSFFSHYSLETTENEHGSDSCLEFENYETYDHYKEFFYDVIPEMETFGKVKLFKTCCNHEPHLRGNVYVEYSSTRSALKAYKVLNGRWYGGKQLNVEFCNIESWKTAICGLFFAKRCPKGNACNFLHVFRNPKNLYSNYEEHTNSSRSRMRDDLSDRRNWRWSESPERMPSTEWDGKDRNRTKKRRSKSKDRSERRRHSTKRRRDNSSSRSRIPDDRSWSRSPDREKSSRSSSRRSQRSYKS